MRAYAIAIIIFLSTAWSHADTRWTYSSEQGEDATSSFYYFFESNGHSIIRVRSVWNGGAQNKPIVTDYFLGSGAIRVKTMEGDRKFIPDLVAGKDAKLKVTSDFKIACEHTGKMLIPPPPDKTLTAEQRIELYNLMMMLAMERKPTTKQAEQGGTDQSATAEESKSGGKEKPKSQPEVRSR